ncbi:MAG: glycoside hydrolase family 88 protein [Marinilabiliaceae bacterium]
MITLAAMVFAVACTSDKQEESMEDLVQRSLKTAAVHSMAMAETLSNQDSLLPRTLDKETGELVTSDSRWWTSGFFPGTLWYLYEHTEDPEIRNWAEEYTSRVEREKHTTDNHDVGFMLYCSFGNGLRLTENDDYAKILATGSRSLSTRYNPDIGLIRSWDFNKDQWQYPVIIDNMMNLELLTWAFQHTGDSTFLNIAISHADKTMKHHYREDNSCWHVVSYDTITGKPHAKNTYQGHSDESAWARGQAWGLYGYTMMFRETGKDRYLEQAREIAGFMIHHPNMPEDGIPYWDYDAPEIPDEPRDASAAAIMASALIELSDYVNDQERDQFLSVAKKQLRTLASPGYLAEPGANANFVLKHSVGALPFDSEVDVPLTYADYYFVEALLRYKKLMKS